MVRVGSNTSVIGLKGSCEGPSTSHPITDLEFLLALVGVGLRVIDATNVIIRNVKVSKVLADAGDAIGVQASTQVWLDHLDLSSDRDHDKVCLRPPRLGMT